MVGEPEKAGLHAVGEHDQSDGHHAVDVVDDAVLGLCEHAGVQRHQAPVEKAAHDAAQAVDGRILGQTFYAHLVDYQDLTKP